MAKKQIVCLATTAWHDHFTRKQQVMSRMTDCEVLYVNPPVTCIARFKDSAAKEYAKRRKAPPERPMEHVAVYTPPVLLPFYNQYRALNRLNQKLLLRPFLLELMAKHGMEKPVVWAYSPTSADLVGSLPKSGLVYDCVDRHSAYQGFINPSVVDGMERDLCRSCDAVFATAKGLYDTLAGYNPDTRLLPNGANFELFNRAFTESFDEPAELASLPRPIFGFVGTLQEWIDYDCIEALAKTGVGSIVCIGPTGAGIDLSRITKYPNVRLLGSRPQTSLPSYIAFFDVCLNPFRAGRLSADVSPLKFYEYLATGKPIVSTRQPLQVNDFAEVVSIADSPSEFVSLCQSAAGRHTPERQEKQLAFARACSWDARIAEMRARLAEKGLLV